MGKKMSPTLLRMEVEARLAQNPRPLNEATEQLLHELQVHQIELEMQNETLRQTQAALEESRDAYADLYEFAPVGYLTLSQRGLVSDANLTAARLLGIERHALINRGFLRFISVNDLDRWERLFVGIMHQHAGFDTGGMGQNIEIDLCRADGTLFSALIDYTTLKTEGNPLNLRIALADISQLKQAQKALGDTEAKYRVLFESITDAIMLLDKQAFFDCNPATLHLFGCLNREDFLGLHPSQISPPTQPNGEDSRILADCRIATAFERGSLRFEWLHCRLNGDAFPAEVLLTSLNMDGKPVLCASVHDITERKQLETALLESRRDLRLLLDSMAEGAYGVDRLSRFSFVNKAFLRLLGFASEDEVLGRPSHETIHHSYPDGNPYPADECKMSQTLQSQQPVNIVDEVFWRKDGTPVAVEYWSYPVIKEGSVAGAIVTFVDITERKANESVIRKLAFHDPLTQLPNRCLLRDRLEQAMASTQRSDCHGAVLFLDLDNFKSLNDTHGHEYGDLLLLEVARRITDCVRKTDTVARFGGDEFIVVLSKLDVDKEKSAAQAGRLADAIRVAIAKPYFLSLETNGKAVEKIEHQCTTSIGIVLFKAHEINVEEIMIRADLSMYQAKANGRNSICFHDKSHG